MDLKEGLHEKIEAVLRSLTPKEQKILRMRFGLGVPGSHSLEETAIVLEASQEKIAEIERRALRKLRRCPPS